MMAWVIGILVVGALVCFVLVRPRHVSPQDSGPGEADADLSETGTEPSYQAEQSQQAETASQTRVSADLLDLNERFLREGIGRETKKLVRVYAHSDLLLIRSLLADAGFNTWVDNQHMNTLFASFSLTGYSDIEICVYEDEAEAALPLVEQYIAELRRQAALGQPGLDDVLGGGRNALYLPEVIR